MTKYYSSKMVEGKVDQMNYYEKDQLVSRIEGLVGTLNETNNIYSLSISELQKILDRLLGTNEQTYSRTNGYE